MNHIEFKQGIPGHLLELEWKTIHPGVRRCVILAAFFSWEYFGLPAVVTTLLRTEPEERALYPNDPKRVSAHQLARACDLRIKHAKDPAAYGKALLARLIETDLHSRWLLEGDSSSRSAHLHGEVLDL